MSSSPLPNRETYRLAKGRVSISGKRYFVTICTRNRYPHFIKQKDRVLGIQILNEMDQASDLHLHCTTFMPDHVHLLFALGESLSLQRVIAKFKANVKRQLSGDGFQWQRNFYDHQIRNEASLEPFALYTFMNPYKNGLLGIDETWEGWICGESFRPEFLAKLKDGKFPQAMWIRGLDLKRVVEEDL